MVIYRVLLLWIAVVLVSGCDEGLPTVPVFGTVTFAGGSPPARGTITFAPLEVAEGLPRRPGRGQFTPEDPAYEVRSFQPGDGLLPGRYAVTINCFTDKPNPAKPETFQTLNAVPNKWKPDELVIEAGSSAVEVNYDVPKKP